MVSMNHEKEPVIELAQIGYRYPDGRKVIDRLDFVLHRGQRIGLLGPNGSGKTTLFHLIMGLLKPDTGRLSIFGRPVCKDKDFEAVYPKVGLLFQDADDQLFSPTVLEDVAFGPLNLGQSPQAAVDIARKTLSGLGLKGFEERITFKLSGGEKRMVALAAVLAMQPEILLMDEPSAGLDEATKERLITVLNQLDLTILMISHESEFMSKVTDRIYMMADGGIRTDLNLHHYVHTHPTADHSH